MSEIVAEPKPVASPKEETPPTEKEKVMSPAEADAKSRAEFQAKFGPEKKVSDFARRKMLAGQSKGRVYFDSGEYNKTDSSSSKAEIQARPHLPMMGKVKKTAPPSKLAN